MAVPCNAVLGMAVPCCAWSCLAVPCSATLCHAVPCHALPGCALPCHIVVPDSAMVPLTRLGGRFGAEQVATSRSHWRVSSSQHPSGDSGDKEHIGTHRCSPGTVGSPVPCTCRQVGDSGCLCVHEQQVLQGGRAQAAVSLQGMGATSLTHLSPGLTVRLRCGVLSTTRRLSAAQHRGGSSSV